MLPFARLSRSSTGSTHSEGNCQHLSLNCFFSAPDKCWHCSAFCKETTALAALMWGASKAWLYSDFLTAKTAYTHFKTSQAIALKFQSTLVFRRQHVMGRELLGFLHPSPRVSWCPGVSVSYAAPYHGACIHSRHWLLFRPSLPNSRDMSWYQKTITGIENTTVSAWAAWFCCFSYIKIIFLSCWSLFYTSLETGSCQEVVLMHSSCSGAPWHLRAHWSERQFDFLRHARANSIWLHFYVS